MRQIILDTETTGLSPEQGHRIIEIGCLEMIDRKLTGRNFHEYINPEREVEPAALQVHGITNEFLCEKPLFVHVLERLIDYIKGAELIIHNAEFDVGFLNYEFQLAKHKCSVEHYCKIFDTLTFARKKHPGQRNSLDALCKRYHVDNSNRELHGALLDAELLAQVYLLMTGGQTQLFGNEQSDAVVQTMPIRRIRTDRRVLPIIMADDEELKAHDDFLKRI